jgi:hypothetical protein
LQQLAEFAGAVLVAELPVFERLQRLVDEFGDEAGGVVGSPAAARGGDAEAEDKED